jgi:hypothetical protein
MRYSHLIALSARKIRVVSLQGLVIFVLEQLFLVFIHKLLNHMHLKLINGFFLVRS